MTPGLPSGDKRALVVAGICVRALAESARQGGWDVIALDLFGDADTRQASVRWASIGEPSSLRIDPGRLRGELLRAARHPRVDGWVPGSGFEGASELLAAGGPALPCLAIAPFDLERVRDPATFFGALDRCSLSHPRISLDRPADPDGWLAKRAGGCGGVHIRAARQAIADPAGLPADTYFQRWQAGAPMSALFVADGEHFRVVALNRLIVQAVGPLPHVYAGAVGPVPDDRLERAVDRVLSVLVPQFRLRGLASLDFLADGSTAHWLEINPRPSATLQLHAGAWPAGLMRAHVDAVRGRLPGTAARRGPNSHGHLTVFADRPGRIAPTPAHRPHVHDLAAPGTHVACGEPLCTVSAEGRHLGDTLRLLEERAAQARRACLRSQAPSAEESCA